MSHCERKRAAASAAYKHFPRPGGLGKSCLRGNSLAPEAVEKRGPRRRQSLFRGDMRVPNRTPRGARQFLASLQIP